MGEYFLNSDESKSYNISNIFVAEIIKDSNKADAILHGSLDYSLLVETGLNIGKNKEGSIFSLLNENSAEYVIFNNDRSVLLNINKAFNLERVGMVTGFQSLDGLLEIADSISDEALESCESEYKAGLAEMIDCSRSEIQSLFDEKGNISKEDLLANREQILALMENVDDYQFGEDNPEDDSLMM